MLAVAAVLATASVPSAAHADGVELGVFGGYHFFSDENELGAFDEDDAPTLGDSAVVGARLGVGFLSYLAAEAEFGVLPSETDRVNTDVIAFVWRGSALAHFLDSERDTRPFVLAGLGGMTGRPDDQAINRDDTDLVFHGGVGVKHHVGAGFGLRADARVLFPPSTGTEFLTTEFELLLGAYKTFGRKAEPAAPADGDRDGDGLLDSDDACPDDPEDFDQFRDDDGCPEDDNDEDSILDPVDECPLEPEDKDEFEDNDGCPDPDNDADGLKDPDDECPLEPEDEDQFEDEDGCPDPDNDGDGILDPDDKCPLEAETKNGFEDSDGCPDEVPEQVKKFTGTIRGIQFRTGSDEIRPSSFPTLGEAVKVLNDYPDIKLEIQGHTDDVGSEDYNRDLSERRALSVKTYFVSAGIAADRLVTRGFGESQPEVPNDSASNRAKNRRVVFVLIQ